MICRLLDATAVGIALLALAVVMLWARSHRTDDIAVLTVPGERSVAMASELGMLYLTAAEGFTRMKLLDLTSGGDEDWHAAMGTLSQSKRGPITLVRGYLSLYNTDDPLAPKRWVPSTGIWTSHLIVALALLVPPTTWLVLRWLSNRLQKRAARRRGCCTACGYDLRASPDRCPECGGATLLRP